MNENHDIAIAKRELTEFYEELLGELLKKAAGPTTARLVTVQKAIDEAMSSIPAKVKADGVETAKAVKDIATRLKVPSFEPDPEKDEFTTGETLFRVNAKLDAAAAVLSALAPETLAAEVVGATAKAIGGVGSPIVAIFQGLLEQQSTVILESASNRMADLSQAQLQMLTGEFEASRDRQAEFVRQHAAAQADLLQKIQKLAEECQVIRRTQVELGAEHSKTSKALADVGEGQRALISESLFKLHRRFWFAATIGACLGLASFIQLAILLARH